MAKRFQPMKEFGRTGLKRPKLDVSTVKSSTSSATSSSKKTYKLPNEKDPLQLAAMWGDEEDDALLIATQVAESKIQDSNKPQEITESEITFSEFQVQGHSTQQPAAQQEVQMFDDDDDEDIASLADALENDVIKSTQSSEKEDDIFKKPQPVSSQRPSTSRNTYYSEDEEPGKSTEAASKHKKKIEEEGKQCFVEEKMQLLMQRLESLSKENIKLKNELTNVHETVQTKTGEATMLRDELRHTRQKLNEMKMERVFQTQSTNAECQSKIEELSKEVKAKESELQLKNMECSVLKIRKADESRRFNETTTQAHDTTQAQDTTAMAIPTVEVDDDDEESGYCLTDADLEANLPGCSEFNPPAPLETRSILLSKITLEKTEYKTYSRKWNDTIDMEYLKLQKLFAQMQLDEDKFMSNALEDLIESVRNVFLAYDVYLDTLYYGFRLTVLPPLEYSVLTDETERIDGCLHSQNLLYPGEDSVQIRRYIALLANMCEKSSDIALKLLSEKYEEKPLLNIPIETLKKMGFCLDVCTQFGALEAFAVFLRCLLLHLDENDEEEEDERYESYFEQIFNLFKQIVFARPNPWTFLELSYSIVDLSYRFPNLFDLFCVNSSSETYVMDTEKSVYRFSSDSCLLQVYCGLMESAFPLYIPLPENIFDLFLQICLNHVRFTMHCLTEQPNFVEIWVSETDDEDSDESGGAEESAEEKQTTDSKKKKDCDLFKDQGQPTTSRKSGAGAGASKVRRLESYASSISDAQDSSDPQKADSKKDYKRPTSTKKVAAVGASKVGRLESYASSDVEDRSDQQNEVDWEKDEQPTTSKKAAAGILKERRSDSYPCSSISDGEGSSDKQTSVPKIVVDYETSDANNAANIIAVKPLSKADVQCKCFEQLCLSTIRMVWLTMRQWKRFDKAFDTKAVARISRIAVHVLYFLFCNNFVTILFREDEVMTKHYIYLLCQWWEQNDEDMKFNEIQVNMFNKLKKSHAIPKLFCEEEPKPQNIIADLAEWTRQTGEEIDTSNFEDKIEKQIKDLRLREELADPEIFFAILKEREINLDPYDFT